MSTRKVGVGHLTMLDAAPPDWVQLAHDAGFEAVGIRIGVAGPAEEPWPMAAGSPMLTETLERLAATGMVVQDVEIIVVTPDTRADEYEGLFEVGARLGARFFNVMVTDTDVGPGARHVRRALRAGPAVRPAPLYGGHLIHRGPRPRDCVHGAGRHRRRTHRRPAAHPALR